MKSFKEYIKEGPSLDSFKGKWVTGNGKKSFMTKDGQYTTKLQNAMMFDSEKAAEDYAFQMRNFHRTMNIKAIQV